MRQRHAVAIVTLTLLVLAAGAVAAGPTYVIQGDASIGGVRLGRTTAPDALAAFAADGASRMKRSPGSCVVTWPRIGLAITFGTLGSDPTDPCTGGTAFGVTVTSRSYWRTAVGLRIGDTAARLRRLYPRAQLHLAEGTFSGYWLVPRRTCSEVGGGSYPGLLARVHGGRVTALVATAGICE